ncbi:MAG: HRDC domain-containing protein [Gammaproteobacteria bacterium]
MRTDWSQRPLGPNDQPAADDVRYLQWRIATRQPPGFAAASATGRLAQFSATERSSRIGQLRRRPGRGSRCGKLKSAQLVVLRTLADWREQQAIQADKPDAWICDDNLLLDLARIQPMAGRTG